MNREFLEKGYFIAGILLAAATVPFMIYQMCEENWKVTCWWIAGIVALVAGIWVITQIPRSLLKRIYHYCFMGNWVAGAARWTFLTVFVLALSLSLTRTTEARDLVAVVDLVHWRSPDAVARELTTIDVRDWCSMYTITLRANNSEGVRKSTLKLPEPCYVEVKKGNLKENYRNHKIITLPSLPNGEQIDIKAWATCKAKRPNAKCVRITHLGGRPARLDVRAPVRTLAQLVNQHLYIAWVCIGVTICAVLVIGGKLLFTWLHSRKSA
jgi:hypothetical protein